MLEFISEFFTHGVANSIFVTIFGGLTSLAATRVFFSLFVLSFAIYVVRRSLWR